MKIGIIGGGIIGCAIARELARRGARVTVLEQRAVGGGATQASAGVLAPYVEAHEPGPLQDLIVRSLGLYDGFIASVRVESGVDIDYSSCGSLEVAVDEREVEVLRATASRFADRGLRWIEATEVRRMCPAIAHSLGGVIAPSHGYVAATDLVRGLARAAEALGTRFRSTRVQAVERTGSETRVRLEGNELMGFDEVVVASGSWTSLLTFEGLATVPVYPVKGQLLRLSWAGRPLETILWSSQCYVVPQRGGGILVGATMEDAGFDERPTVSGVASLLHGFRALLPSMADAVLVEALAGLRPATADGLPLVGRSERLGGVTFACGHFRNGIVLAPLTAELVADLLVSGRHDPVLDALTPARFGI